MPQGGALPMPPVGTAQVYVGSTPVQAEVTETGPSALQVTGPDGVSMGLQGNCPNDAAAGVTGTSGGGLALRLGTQCQAVVSGAGFAPGTTVHVWAIPQDGGAPIELASLSVTQDGLFLGSSALHLLSAGAYTVQANGLAADGSVRSTNLGVSVSTSGTLPSTGSDGSATSLAAWFVIAGGLALAAARRRRRPALQLARVSSRRTSATSSIAPSTK